MDIVQGDRESTSTKQITVDEQIAIDEVAIAILPQAALVISVPGTTRSTIVRTHLIVPFTGSRYS